jgi:hypothetical protein
MISVMLLGRPAMHAMIRDVGIGEAVHSVIAMAEGDDRRRRNQTEGGEGSDCHRYAEPKPGPERSQHRSSLQKSLHQK